MQHLKNKKKEITADICVSPSQQKTLNDLLSFSVYLLDDANKEITFFESE